jgi:periplasmic copper chaperone A
MRLYSFFGLMAFCLLSVSGLAMAASAADGVAISDAYVRAVPPGQPNSASFMTVKNSSGSDHALVGGSSPAAEVVELHTHTMEDGMMRMRQVERIDLPAGKDVTLKPGGLHVMLIGLKQKLIPGEKVPLTLKFEDGSEVAVDAPVHKLQMKMKKMKMDHNHM